MFDFGFLLSHAPSSCSHTQYWKLTLLHAQQTLLPLSQSPRLSVEFQKSSYVCGCVHTYAHRQLVIVVALFRKATAEQEALMENSGQAPVGQGKLHTLVCSVSIHTVFASCLSRLHLPLWEWAWQFPFRENTNALLSHLLWEPSIDWWSVTRWHLHILWDSPILSGIPRVHLTFSSYWGLNLGPQACWSNTLPVSYTS